MIRKTLAALVLSALVSGTARAQDVNTNSALKNITTMLNGGTTIPVSTNVTVNVAKKWFDAAGQYIDLGGTFTVGFNHGNMAMKPSFTAMAKVPIIGLSGTWYHPFKTTFAMDWQAGPIFSYVPAWDEYDAGFGATASLFRVPPALTAAQLDTPVADTLPKLSIVKAFTGGEIALNDINHQQVFRAVFGIAIPM